MVIVGSLFILRNGRIRRKTHLEFLVEIRGVHFYAFSYSISEHESFETSSRTDAFEKAGYEIMYQ